MRTILRLALIVLLTYAGLLVVMWLGRNRIIFPIRGGSAGDPGRFGMADGQAVMIPTTDGAHIGAWYLPPRRADRAAGPGGVEAGAEGAVIWFHGNAETVADLGSLLREFRPPRAALLVVDYRGIGASTGSPSPAASLDDAAAAWDWLAARPEIDATRIVVYGRSIGTGPAAWLAASRPAAGLILESPFTSLGDMARAGFPPVPGFLAGGAFDNRGAIARVAAPTLIIHGERDRTIPPRMSRELAERAAGPVETWVIQGADHNETYELGGEEYLRRFRGFVARWAERPRP